MKSKRNALLLIDVQNDFCKPNGALYVNGAENDVQRMSNMIEQNQDLIDYISLTMDSHQMLHIAHPAWWMDKNGNQPQPFTPITLQQINNGEWTPRLYVKESISYIKELESNGEYSHFIWNPHCIVGSEGAAIVDEVMTSVKNWQSNTLNMYQIVQKGQFPLSEHFGALRANVPFKGESSTEFNNRLYNTLNNYKRVYLMGEAKSHCVANTLKQMLQYCPDLLPKLFIVEDAMSDVATFEGFADHIFDEARKKGVQFCTTTNMNFLT